MNTDIINVRYNEFEMLSLLPVFPFAIVMNSIFVHCYFRAIEYTWFVHVVPSKILFIVLVNIKNMNDKIVENFLSSPFINQTFNYLRVKVKSGSFVIFKLVMLGEKFSSFWQKEISVG